MKKGTRLSVDYGQIFLLCFLAGIVLGTMVGNVGMEKTFFYGGGSDKTGRPGVGQSLRGVEEKMVQDRPWRQQAGDVDKFLYILRQRLCEGAVGWLLGLTVCAAPCFWGMAGYMGFSVGWVIARYTAGWGLLGLPRFFLSCFPQWLFYLPAWGLFIWLGSKRPVRVRLFPALLAFGLLFLGAGAEAFANPFFLNIL